ncbi:sigma 54-interacting transcriptional regulator [Sorangium cellulosum]|uniref:sigma 54-interacting transcriptional regulator n=1 Tax=Sorangium cellulosum TaxID=56 RepID=UPI003D9A8705
MPRVPDSGTISATPALPAAADGASGAHLFLVLEGHRPLAPPVRVALAGLGEIVVGRGAARSIEARTAGAVHGLVVRAPDPWLSSTHARLVRVLQRWMFEDAGSKNGSSVNGVRVPRAELRDGDVIELGHTFFVFRAALPSAPGAPAVFDASALDGAAPGLATLLPPLGRKFAQIAPIARSAISVLIEGETGTGKEVVARALHALSGRSGDFVALNCGALPRELVEGELFGHRRGAFSGATEDRVGLVRSADRGTLFLDEIGDLPASSQAALLRVLQEREVRPVGGTRAVPVDLRVLAATHRPLDQMVASGDFRADLLARLTGHRLDLPPLRDRREDLGLLAAALLRRLDPAEADRVQLHPGATRALLGYSWPGNIRELEKCLETSVVLAGEARRVELEHLPEAVQRASAEASRPASEDKARREELLALLREHRGNITRVADAMGKARMQIQRWLKRYGIDPEQFRG